MGRPLRSQSDIDDFIVFQLLSNYEIVDGCWIWVGRCFGNGYPRVSHYSQRASFHQRAHIASYQYHNGPVADGLFVCHSCDNKRCINPNHLWLGTNQQNQIDAVQKGVFKKIWTKEKRMAMSKRVSGTGNPMFGRLGESAPCYGRTGDKHPMFGKSQSVEAKKKISDSLKANYRKKHNE